MIARRSRRQHHGPTPSVSHVEAFEEKYDSIYNDVTDTVHFEDVEEFIEHMEDTTGYNLPYGYKPGQAALIILHWMCFHDQTKTRDLNYEYGMPSNGIQRILKKCAGLIEEFSQEHIKWGTVETRTEKSRRSMPAGLQTPLPTFIIDGTHILVSYHDPVDKLGLNGDSPFSYKLKKKAANFQVAIDGNMQCIWTDNGQPGGVHDIRAVWRSDLERRVDEIRDVGMGDLGYLNDRLNFLMITPYKKPINGELTEVEKRYNKMFNGKRVQIEQFFGLVKRLFPIFRCGYRGPLECLAPLFRLGCTFVNKSIERGRVTERDLRDAYEEEKRNQRNYEDQPLTEDPTNFPELGNRRRTGRVVIIPNASQEEEELWSISRGRRSDPERYQLAFSNMMTYRREREEEEIVYHEQRRLELFARREALNRYIVQHPSDANDS